MGCSNLRLVFQLLINRIHYLTSINSNPTLLFKETRSDYYTSPKITHQTVIFLDTLVFSFVDFLKIRFNNWKHVSSPKMTSWPFAKWRRNLKFVSWVIRILWAFNWRFSYKILNKVINKAIFAPKRLLRRYFFLFLAFTKSVSTNLVLVRFFEWPHLMDPFYILYQLFFQFSHNFHLIS